MGRLGIGQMARLNGVSERTLRFYQKKGILEPRYVDEQTGYRYYDISQSTKLDLVEQLQALGFSLEEIREVNEAKDISHLRERAAAHLEEIDARLLELALDRRAALDMIRGCDAYLDPPILDQLFLEQLPERHVILFPLENAERTRSHEGVELDIRDEWEFSLRQVKRQMAQRGYPMQLFRDVGCYTSRENVEDGCLDIDHAFIEVDESCGPCFADAVALPAGSYLTMYAAQAYTDAGDELGSSRARRAFDYMRAKGLALDGPLIDEVICRYPRLFNEGSEILYRMSLKVRRLPRP